MNTSKNHHHHPNNHHQYHPNIHHNHPNNNHHHPNIITKEFEDETHVAPIVEPAGHLGTQAENS